MTVGSIPSAYTHASGQAGRAVRFGWSAARPPQYELRLTRGDITDNGLATPELVNRAKGLLVGDSDETPRFCVLTNTRQLLGENEAIKRFQKNLLMRLVESYQPTGYINEWGKQVSYSGFEHDFAAKNNNGFSTVQRPHWDSEGIFSSILYGPFKGFKGGYPQLYDLRDPIRKSDDPSAMRKELIYESMSGFDFDYFVQTDHPLAKAHRVVLDKLDFKNDRPLLIFNNNTIEGVAHGVTEPRRVRKRAVRNGFFFSPMPSYKKPQ